MEDNWFHHNVEGFLRLSEKEFLSKFEDEVGDLSELEVVAARPHLNGEARLLQNGFVLYIDQQGRWSMYETTVRYEYNKSIRDWAEVPRGYWSEKVPTEPGLYFVKDLDLGRMSVREIVRHNGRLRDVSGGMPKPGAVSAWAGYWWLPKIPKLPDSY